MRRPERGGEACVSESSRLRESTPQPTHLLPHERLLDGRQVLQRAHDEVRILWPADILCKAAELLGEDEQDLVLVVELVLEEHDELVACPLRTERERDRREPANRGEAQVHVVRLELVHKQVDRVDVSAARAGAAVVRLLGEARAGDACAGLGRRRADRWGELHGGRDGRRY